MTDEEKTPQSCEKVSSYKGKQITTVFDEKGQIMRVFAQDVNPEREGKSELAKMIDHTLLKADATVDQITKLCQEAIEYGFGAVCVNGYWVKHCKQLLEGSQVKTCGVAGFLWARWRQRPRSARPNELSRMALLKLIWS